MIYASGVSYKINMFTFKGIAVTDKTNLYNEKFTLQAMYSAYEKQWNDIFPSFANHDHKISIGFSKLTGIYIDAQMAYMTNSLTIGENEDEEKKIRDVNFRILYKTAVLDNIDKYRTLENKLDMFKTDGTLQEIFSYTTMKDFSIL